MREQRKIDLGPGLAGFILILVVAWALAAVVMLTGTLENARQINSRVKLINAQVDPIKGHTAFINLAAKTADVTTQIRAAAANLSSELTEVIDAAARIDTKVNSILTTAQSIHGVAGQINANALSINSRVQGINSSVQTISSDVSSVGRDVASVHADVANVFSAVGPGGGNPHSIAADVPSIAGRLTNTLGSAGGIRTGVIAINNRAQTVIDLVGMLKGDFDPILAIVGTVAGTGTILGHANSIDCSPLINLLGATSMCNK